MSGDAPLIPTENQYRMRYEENIILTPEDMSILNDKISYMNTHEI